MTAASTVVRDTIVVHDGTYTEAVVLGGKAVDIEAAPGATVIFHAAGGDDGFLRVETGGEAELVGVTVDGLGAHRALRLANDGKLTVRDSVLRDGVAGDGKGGCVKVSTDAEAWVYDTRFEGCTASDDGGALFVHNSARLTVDGGVFDGNHADDRGGAVHCRDSAVCELRGSAFLRNSAGNEGGAFDANASNKVYVYDSLFAYNTADEGGAVRARTDFELEGNVFCENSALTQGGALYATAVTDAYANHFVGNTAGGLGAAVVGTDELNVVNNLLWGNQGVGAVLSGTASTTLSYGWFYENTTADEDVPGTGNSTFGVDPEVVDYQPGNCEGSDFALQPTSPLIDSGDPDSAFDDPDGSRGDIGAFQPDFSSLPIDPGGGGSDTDGDGVDDGLDCAPNDASVYPGALETPVDGVDQDCDGVDDCYVDGDGDGFGDGTAPGTTLDCTGPGEAVVAGDCDDAASAVHPAAVEVCDAADTDEDCNGVADDADAGAMGTLSWYVDGDGDGFGAGAGTSACDPGPTEVAVDGDCDDARADVNPGASEVCDPDNVDEDCDGDVDDADPSVVGQVEWPLDGDGDGFVGDDVALACDPIAPGLPSGDCDDGNPAVNPNAQEVCDTLDVDEDCDGVSDDDDPSATGQVPLFVDDDGDGYGSDAVGAEACDPEPRQASAGGDCDDARADVNPGASEVCDPDDVDEDCNGLADDADPGVTGALEGYVDLDGDGFGAGDLQTTCEPIDALVAVDGDCDDGDAGVLPGGMEVSDDGIDQNCDGADLVVTWGSGAGCGCASSAGPPGSSLLALLLLGVGLGRRRP